MEKAFVYAIIFSDGLTKVGMSMTLSGVDARLETHKRRAKKSGLLSVWQMQAEVDAWSVLLRESDLTFGCRMSLGLPSPPHASEWFKFDSADEAIEVLSWVFPDVLSKQYRNFGDASEEAFRLRVSPKFLLNQMESTTESKPS